MLALCPDKIDIDGKNADAYIAIDTQNKDFGEYSAIVPNILI